MEYCKLGNTGLIVSRLALGTWTFGSPSGSLTSVYKVDATLARDLVAHALDSGINLFDTADRYSAGQSEVILGELLVGRRADAVVCTKVGLRNGEQIIHAGLSKRHILRSIDESLRRLRTDWVDLYLAHCEDATTPLEETVEALDQVVRSGKARYIGYSNWSPWRAAAAVEMQRANNLAQFSHGQMHYALTGRSIEHEYLSMSRNYGLGLVVWSPLAMGLLTGKFKPATVLAPGTRFSEVGVLSIDYEKAFVILDRLASLGRETGRSVAQLALSWLLAKCDVTSVLVGATSLAQLHDNLGAGATVLTAAQVAELDSLSAPSGRWSDIALSPDKVVSTALAPRHR